MSDPAASSADAPGLESKDPPVELTNPIAEGSPSPSVPKWATSRIDELTKNWRREQERNKAIQLEAEIAKKELEALRAAGAKPGETPAPKAGVAPKSEAEIRQEIEREAERLAAIRAFNAECAKVAEQGRSEFPTFDADIKDLRESVGLTQSMVEAALEMDHPHRVLHALTQDKDEAHRILSLPVARQAAAVAKLAAKLEKAPRTRTAAPDPIAPKVGGTGRTGKVDLYDDKTDSKEWFAAREAELAAKRKARVA